MIRAAVFAPIQTSVYARLVTHLLATEPGVELVGLVVRTPWTYRRLRAEIRRDGARLLWKAYQKLVLRERAYEPTDEECIYGLARRVGLPGRTLVDLATLHRVPLTVVKDLNDSKSQQALKAARPDVVAFTGGALIRRETLAIPTTGILNCHMGPLPRYRGMDVVEWPLAEWDRGGPPPEVGLTVHLMDEGLDTGPILLQKPIEIRENDTFRAIRSRMESAMVDAMLEAVRLLRDGTASPAAQAVKQGRQYFVMHPRMQQFAHVQLQRYLASRTTRPENETQ